MWVEMVPRIRVWPSGLARATSVAAMVPAGGFERFTAAAPLDIALLVGPCRLAETDSHWPLPATLHVLPPIIAASLAIALP